MPESTATAPFKMTLGDGTVVEGKDMEEAFNKLAKMKEDTSAWAKQQQQEASNAKAEADRLRAQLADVQKPKTQPQDGKFNNNRYYELLNEDPIAAQNYLDAYRFGIDSPDQVPAAFNDMRNQISVIQAQSVGAAFVSEHAADFPGTPEAVKAIRERTQHLVEREGFPFGLNTLNYAYDQLVREGVIKPNEPGDEREPEPPNPSMTGGGGGISDAELAKAETLSDKDLEALLRSKGVLK